MTQISVHKIFMFSKCQDMRNIADYQCKYIQNLIRFFEGEGGPSSLPIHVDICIIVYSESKYRERRPVCALIQRNVRRRRTKHKFEGGDFLIFIFSSSSGSRFEEEEKNQTVSIYEVGAGRLYGRKVRREQCSCMLLLFVGDMEPLQQ